MAEFDRREGWRVWEQASCAAWLSWQCGLSLTTAHEHVRVARALESLPQVRPAFGAGEVSFSKVRALTRIATAANEGSWLQAARAATASQLDRLVRACLKVSRGESEDRVEREKLSWRWDDDGMLVVSARLAPERGARLLSALDQIQHAAAEAAPNPDTVDNAADETSNEGMQYGATTDADGGAAHPGDEALREVGRDRGPATAVDALGNSDALAGAGGGAEVSAHGAAPRPSRESSAEDVIGQFGCSLPEALVAMADTVLVRGPRGRDAGGLYQVVIHVGGDSIATSRHEAGGCYVDGGPAIHPATLRRKTCAGATAVTMRADREGTPLDVGRATRVVPAGLRRAVLDRAGGRCQFPGCEHRSWLQIHHVEHWIDGGATSYANLAVLCGAHHRAHHAGLFGIVREPAAPGGFVFHLADGTPVPHAPTPPRTAGHSAPPAAPGDQAGTAITPETIRPVARDRLHLDHAVNVMLRV